MIDATQLTGVLTHANSERGLSMGRRASDDAAITQMEAGAMSGALYDLPFFERSFIEWSSLMRADGPMRRWWCPA